MIPITRFSNFLDAHNEFFTLIAKHPDLAVGPKPVNANELNVIYLIYQDEYRNIQCQYEIADRHYTQVEIKRLIKKHQKSLDNLKNVS